LDALDGTKGPMGEAARRLRLLTATELAGSAKRVSKMGTD
jgi:hypothetical protein